MSNCNVAGFTLGAQRVPKDRRRSWALANLPSDFRTTTFARLPMLRDDAADPGRRHLLVGVMADELEDQPGLATLGVWIRNLAKSGVMGSSRS